MYVCQSAICPRKAPFAALHSQFLTGFQLIIKVFCDRDNVYKLSFEFQTFQGNQDDRGQPLERDDITRLTEKSLKIGSCRPVL